MIARSVHAAHLGIAMQLTNICRDVAEDARAGRRYVPDTLLAKGSAVRELLAVADDYYRSGDRGIRALPWRAALAVATARRVYAAIGKRIAHTGYDVAAGRAVVSRGRKLVEVARAAAYVAGRCRCEGRPHSSARAEVRGCRAALRQWRSTSGASGSSGASTGSCTSRGSG